MSIRAWVRIHAWSSLVCTLFLLMLCLTGLPLIFHDEIDAWSARAAAAPSTGATADNPVTPPSLDTLAARVRRAYPARAIRFIVWLEDTGQYRFGLTPTPGVAGEKPFVLVDRRDGRLLGEAWSEKDWRHGGVMAVLLRLHTDLLADTPGRYLLGAMGVLFLASLISGAVLYLPFTRKLRFGRVRRGRGRRIYYLDLHNLLGIVTLAWAFLLGLTGVVNTLDALVFDAWQAHAIQHRPADLPAPGPAVPDPLQHAVDLASRTLPRHQVNFLAMPGSMFSTAQDYTVFMHGSNLVSRYLLQPVLVRATDGQLVSTESPPWFLAALEASRPLHFGDFGGLPLKLLWAALDLATIAVLLTGLYLYVRRKMPAAGRRHASTAGTGP
ncbi:MAG: PepSY-associated TM helix domain-containing protein [Pseudomonas sp.]